MMRCSSSLHGTGQRNTKCLCFGPHNTVDKWINAVWTPIDLKTRKMHLTRQHYADTLIRLELLHCAQVTGSGKTANRYTLDLCVTLSKVWDTVLISPAPRDWERESGVAFSSTDSKCFGRLKTALGWHHSHIVVLKCNMDIVIVHRCFYATDAQCGKTKNNGSNATTRHLQHCNCAHAKI